MASISPVNNSKAVSLRGVTKHYGALHAVDGVDLDIARGEIFGLIGHNGAGKSTLFKMMLGLIPATSGEILVGGASVRGRGFRAARRHLGYLPENVVLYDNLSGLETLRFFAKLKGAPLAQCQPALDRVGLAHAGKRPVREYSKGMRQRLGFAQALLGNPQVLLLDEPTNGLDPQAIRDFYATLRELQGRLRAHQDASATLQLGNDSVGTGLITNLRAGSSTFVRLRARGLADSIESGQRYSLTIDTALKVMDAPSRGDVEGLSTLEWSFRNVYDATWAKWCQITLVTTVTGL
mgnify:CR=1 FL=1